MVHALQQIHRLLRPNGILIDIHPIPEPLTLEVHKDGRLLFAEPDPDYTGEDYRHAESALAQAIQHGLFVTQGTAQFDFFVYASSMAELRDFLAEANAYEHKMRSQEVMDREEELAARAEEARQSAGAGAQVATHERTRITALRALN